MLIKEGDEIAGFMEINDGWLHHLYIAPNFQDKGFGKLLLDEAKELSPTGIQLMVFEGNKGAIKFYEREGFILVEKRNQEQTKNEENLPDRKYHWN
jgi:ribosomal protein S18 acetylase RimI-like enzyme